jgi:hypothetical protein
VELKLLKGDLKIIKEVISEELFKSLFDDSVNGKRYYIDRTEDFNSFCLKEIPDESYSDRTVELVSEAIDTAISKVLKGERW